MDVGRQHVGEQLVDPGSAELAGRQADAVHDDEIGLDALRPFVAIRRRLLAGQLEQAAIRVDRESCGRWIRRALSSHHPHDALKSLHDVQPARPPPASARRTRSARRLAPLHADEGPRVVAADPDRAGRRGLAVRLRRPALPRCHQLLVGQPVRPRQPAHQRGHHRPARQARARDPGRLYPRARGAAGRKADPPRAARPDALLLRGQWLERDRSRAQDELPLLAQPGPVAQAALHHPVEQLSRRDARRAGRWPRRAVPRDLPAAADGRDDRTLARCVRARGGRNRRGLRTPRHRGDERAAGRDTRTKPAP